jgi:hypothetical protein
MIPIAIDHCHVCVWFTSQLAGRRIRGEIVVGSDQVITVTRRYVDEVLDFFCTKQENLNKIARKLNKIHKS